MIPAFIVDLDGTLADCNHRRHFVQDTLKPDWRSFYESMVTDSLNKPVADVVNALWRTFRWKLIIVTGRPYTYSGHTTDWLDIHPLPPALTLLMRREGDFRPDDIVKKEIYEEHIRPYYDIKLVIDDRDKVVKMWRSLGFTVFQCAEGNF